MSTRNLTSKCPWCGYDHDRVTSLLGDHEPQENDATMCINCGRWCCFTADLELRKPDHVEAMWLAADRDCKELARLWRVSQNTAGLRRGK